MIEYYQNPGNDLHTAFPQLHGSLGTPIYKSKGRVKRNTGWQRCRIIQQWAEHGEFLIGPITASDFLLFLDWSDLKKKVI